MEYIVKYRALLMAENQRQNLVSRRTIEADFDKHVQDSLQVLEYTSLDGLKTVDLGSGAGFPGLLLAIKCPAAEFTLIESDQKKSGFLNRAVADLGLDHVQVINRRVEEMGRDRMFREQYDVVTARAVAGMNVLLEYGVPLLKPGGCGWFWKGIQVEEEIEQARKALKVLQARVEAIHWYRLQQERDRALVRIVKEEATPDAYPRRVGIPSKRPL